MSKRHPFKILSEIIENYSDNRLSYDIDKLQDIREEISVNLYLLSDSASKALSETDLADFERKRHYSESLIFHKTQTSDEGKSITVAEAESLARIDNKTYEEAYCEATRKKERVKIILNSVQQILNALSSRISMLK